jgi:hypothetical protein
LLGADEGGEEGWEIEDFKTSLWQAGCPKDMEIAVELMNEILCLLA